MAGPDQIQHVSDTALMVAACRALETARADGLVRDPFAARLAGSRGDAILHGITGWELMCFGIGVRTRFLDDLVIETIARGSIKVVLSVGAGLDTRPWRLNLPPGLHWIEADLPEMLGYKTERVGGAAAALRARAVRARHRHEPAGPVARDPRRGPQGFERRLRHAGRLAASGAALREGLR